MDTDELTEMSWDIIVYAASVSDTLKAELGTLANDFKCEDEWLRGALAHLEEIIEDPRGYAEFWDLETEEHLTEPMIKDFAGELRNRIIKILTIPIGDRGEIAW